MIQASDVRRAAMDLLARREHSTKELKEKILKRFLKYQSIEPADIHSTSIQPEGIDVLVMEQIERLRDEGLQSDARMAEAYIRARSNRGHGPQKIAMELRGKGVCEFLVAKTLAESGIDWASKIRSVALKKYGDESPDMSLDMTQYQKWKAKRNRFLLQRGFSYELISVLDD